ncbi:hypothetical protein HBH56_099620 [Parastagonospora nodorum]|nr:hypothetical protein HBH56_099620 [Parastagonospora nodorum]KAH3930526.1 hypothetical protein HBH54_113940 [Parastagonospora nodorum]KAH3942770.1 hypothetical protein HBH53_182030 [Parastagonospora nodorum]KAH4002893.1 hypothetical protein HBI10_065400 [Parastagonospora nodorum]KAH4022769.1 hypothetical protein HBI09_167500 [Parastagonospora nodorum]
MPHTPDAASYVHTPQDYLTARTPPRYAETPSAFYKHIHSPYATPPATPPPALLPRKRPPLRRNTTLPTPDPFTVKRHPLPSNSPLLLSKPLPQTPTNFSDLFTSTPLLPSPPCPTPSLRQSRRVWTWSPTPPPRRVHLPLPLRKRPVVPRRQSSSSSEEMVFRRAGTWPVRTTTPSVWPSAPPAVDYGNARECLRILNEYVLDEKGESEVKKMWEFKRGRIGNVGVRELELEIGDLKAREAMMLSGEMTKLGLEPGE